VFQPRTAISSATVVALLLAFAPSAGTQTVGAEGCGGAAKLTVDVGIVKAIGCWTQSTVDGATVYTARYDNQKDGIDLNGFVVTGPKGGGLRINTSTRRVTSVAVDAGADDRAQLNSRNWPGEGQINPLGGPLKLDFVAPMNSPLLLEDLQLGSNSVARSLAGLSPFGTVETPVRLEASGTGSMDLTVMLAGVFTLKGKPQSVTINLETESQEGTKVDGFEIHLQEIDAIKAFKIADLEASYSAANKELSGAANGSFGFVKGDSKGFGFGFKIQDGTITEASLSVSGVQIPIGAAGFITDIAGGFHFENRKEGGGGGVDVGGYCKSLNKTARLAGPQKGTNAAYAWRCDNDGLDMGKACRWQYGGTATSKLANPNDAYTWSCVGAPAGVFLSANAQLGAEFGPPIPTPFGKIPPIRVDAALDIGYAANELLVRIHGGVAIFRLPVGDVYLAIHSNPVGVEFGVGLGIGFPSFRNNENDPFYIGGRVDGWVGGGKFQLQGKGRVALFGAKLFDGRLLVNDRAAGACWVVLGANGGAVYVYGTPDVKTFGIGCGLDDYTEQFPAGRAAAAGQSRSFSLSRAERVLDVKGRGQAPRFTLRSADGRVFRTPTRALSGIAKDHAFFVNEASDTTHVVLRDPEGSWTVTPAAGSATIISLKAAKNAPRERVTAKVEGSGPTRTLVWSSMDRPNTKLLFSEVAASGAEVPILETDRAEGRRRFTLAPGYGKRTLRVVVKHGFGSRQSAVVDSYTVKRPSRLGAPASVSAWRDEQDVVVTWSPVLGANGYMVEVSMRQGGRTVTNYVRRVSSRTRSIVIPRHPGGGTAEAKVYALNSEGALGAKGTDSFPTGPSARTLSEAARRSAESALLRGTGVDLRTHCPENGHCRARAELRLNGRVVATAGYQQTPDTFRVLRLVPKSASARQALRGDGDVRVVVTLTRSSGSATANGRPKGRRAR
jgi:hypothetical protein